MTAEQLFSFSNYAAMVGWIILILLPRNIKPLFFVAQYLIPFGLGILYSGLALSNLLVADGGFDTLAGVRTLFANDNNLLAGWVHYLAFDLFIGAWIARRSDGMGMHRLIQAPILVATYLLGPIGLVLYLTMRAGFRKNKDTLHV